MGYCIVLIPVCRLELRQHALPPIQVAIYHGDQEACVMRLLDTLS